jgi:ABC-2 type transport system permease protein
MWKDAGFIASRDLRFILREKQSLFWLFVMPIVFFYFIGTVTSGFGTTGGTERPIIRVERPTDAGFLADQLIGRLQEMGYAVHPPDAQAQGLRLLRIPSDFTGLLLRMQPVTLHFVRRAKGLDQQFDVVRLNRAAYTLLADLIVVDSDDMPLEPQSFAKIRGKRRPVTLAVQSAGQRLRIPTGFEQAIPGIMVMFTLVVLLTSGAVLLVVERNQGLLRRLASTPIRKGSIVLGKWLSRMGIGAIQIAFGAVVGTLLFGMDWGPYWLPVIIVLVLWSGLCASLALLLGSLARTEGQAVAIGVLSANLLAALGGCWWPIEITPRWMQTLSSFLPTGWTMQALHQLVNFQRLGEAVWIQVVLLVAAAIAAGVAAAHRFRYQ